VIRRVNQTEDNALGQKKQTSNGQIKVAALSNKRAKQSDPRLAWVMFHKIATMYRDMKNQEHRSFMELNKTGNNTTNNNINTDDLKDIQPRDDQVWNCDEIGFDPNGSWYKIICTGDLIYGIPSNWIVHCTPSGYMDRDGWFKSIIRFSAQYGNDPFNPQFLFFDGHDSHFDADSFDYMHTKNIQPFILKSGDSTNDQPNDNGSNGKLKACYNKKLAEWRNRFGTTTLTKAHMNSILVDAWKIFKMDCAETVKNSFMITKIFPLTPPDIVLDDGQVPVNAGDGAHSICCF
jgi:hypothetical protein